MKKKIVYLLSTIVMLVVFTSIGCIVWNMPEETKEVDLIGDWKVYQQNQQPIDNEYMCFEQGKAFDYRDDWITPYASGEYKIENNHLKIPSLNKEYKIQVISNNQIILVEDNQSRTCLFRVSEMNNSFKQEDLYQNWTVRFHAGKKIDNEIVMITEDYIKDYRNDELYMEATYQWVDANTFYVDDLQSEFDVYYLNDHQMMMYQVNGGYVWELEV